MKVKYVLRLAAVILVGHLLGHIVGHSSWDQPDDPGMKLTVEAMKTHTARFMGATHGLADYYEGYSFLILGVYAMTSWLLWIISSRIDADNRLRSLLLPIAICYLYFGVVEFIHFFPFAAALSFLAGVFAAIGYFGARGNAGAQSSP